MALPKAVQKQIDEANRLHETLSKGPPPADDGQPPAPAAAAAPTPPDLGATPPAAPSGGEPATPPAPATEGWEQKYRVLQGKYNAEVPRMQRQVHEQSGLIQQLQQQLTATQTMLASLTRQQGAAPAAPAAPTALVKKEEVETFGEDLTDYIRRVAQEAVLPQVEQRLQPVQQQVEQVRSVASQVVERSAQTAQERMFETLDRDIPDWRKQNNDEGFLAWLAQQDPYSGETRQALLRRAYERNDTPRVVAFFKGYRSEHAVVTPPPAPAAATPPPAPQKTLDSFVAPGTVKAGATGAQDGAGKRIWTQAEIGQFYNDRRAGKYRANPERAAELERDIVAAGREGRVR